MKATEIVLIPFPFTDLTATKKRPVLILTRPDDLGDFIALPITSKKNHPFLYSIHQEDLSKGSLPKTSYVRYDKIFTLNTKIVCGRIAQMKTMAFNSVKKNMCEYINCCFDDY